MTTTVQIDGLIAGGEVGYTDHLRRHGPAPSATGLIEELGAAGLTGRGGAGFPAARKLAAVRAARGHSVLVGNGAEGEPLSAKDRWLLTRSPHLVLDGLSLAARALDAAQVYLYVQSPAVPAMRAALAQRDDRVRLVEAADGFLSGEESAVVRRLNHGPAVPTAKTRPVYSHGVSGLPTAVLNVETLAHIALIARRGAGWFRSYGTPAEPGTCLVTVSGTVREVELGTPLHALVGDDRGPVLVGGYHGAWLHPDDVDSAALSRESLARFGASPGAGVLHTLAPGTCGLSESARILDHLAGQSARQCGPCRNGLPTMAALLSQVTAGTAAELARLSAVVAGRGACHHPDGTVRFVRSVLRVFGAEIDAHLAGRCSR